MGFRIPKDEPERPLKGMNTVDDPETLDQNVFQSLINSFPGTTITPRFGILQEYGRDGTTSSETELFNTQFIPGSIGVEKYDKKYILSVMRTLTSSSEWYYRIVVHNVTNHSTQQLHQFYMSSEIHVEATFVKLYDSVYLFFNKELASNYDAPAITSSMILECSTDGVWSIRQNGIDISPQVDYTEIVSSSGFGLTSGLAQYATTNFDNKLWIFGGTNASGAQGILYNSTEGSYWSAVPTETYGLVFDSLGNIIYDSNGNYVVTTASMGSRYSCRMTTFLNKMWMVGGRSASSYYDDIWYSEDGTVWYKVGEVGCGGRYGFGLIVLGTKMYLIGGFNSSGTAQSDVWSTSDGLTWTQVTQTAAYVARGDFAYCVYNNEVYIHGGPDTKIYKSSNCASWTLVASNAGLGTRSGHSFLVRDGYMWCFAGNVSGTGAVNDVYKSTTGSSWSTVTAAAAFSARYYFTAMLFYDKFYAVCGYTGSTYPANAYSSVDGATWAETDSGLTPNKFYDYAFTYVRRTDTNGVYTSLDSYDFTPWETLNGRLILGRDEKQLTGVVDLSGFSLTGTATLFSTELSVGDHLRIGDELYKYTVTEITDDTHATVDISDTHTGAIFTLMAQENDPKSTDEFDTSVCESVESEENRTLVYASSSSTKCRILLKIVDNAEAREKGATHVRVWRTLGDSSATVAQGLDHRYLCDIALSGYDKWVLDEVGDTTLAGELNLLETTGLSATPAGNLVAWVGDRMWVGGNSEYRGRWWASILPTDRQKPQKYASLFDMDEDYISCDPEDNQEDTAAFEFLGSLYISKQRKIFEVVDGDIRNPPRKVSHHLGVAFPKSIAFGVDPSTLQPAVFFMSESGPAIMTSGGAVRLLIEFAVSELWPGNVGIITDVNGEDTTIYNRYKVLGAYFQDTYWVSFGDTEDLFSSIRTPKIYGCSYASDGKSFGALEVAIDSDMPATEILDIIPFSNTKAYCLSHKSLDSGDFCHRIMQFLASGYFFDQYTPASGDASDGKVAIQMSSMQRSFLVGEFGDDNSVLEKIFVRASFGDTEALTVTATADTIRGSCISPYTQVRNSGVSFSLSAYYRKSLTIILKDGMVGSVFDILLVKTVPKVATVIPPVTVYWVKIEVRPFKQEFEFVSGSGALPSVTYVVNANATPEEEV